MTWILSHKLVGFHEGALVAQLCVSPSTLILDKNEVWAVLVELADTQVLGACVERRGGSSPTDCTARGVHSVQTKISETPLRALPE